MLTTNFEEKKQTQHILVHVVVAQSAERDISCQKPYRTKKWCFYRRKEMALLESASAAASDVTQAMMAVKIELDEKKRTSDLLQRALVTKHVSFDK